MHVVDLRVDTLTSLADKYAMMFLKFPLFWLQSPLLKDLGYFFFLDGMGDKGLRLITVY